MTPAKPAGRSGGSRQQGKASSVRARSAGTRTAPARRTADTGAGDTEILAAAAQPTAQTVAVPGTAAGNGAGASADGATARMARLKQAVSKIRVRGFTLDMPRMIMIAGGAFLILGLVFIGLAWYGASHTPYLFEQIPYLISGGLLGLGLAFIGGFLYFAYWLTRMVRDSRRETDRAIAALVDIKSALDGFGSPNGSSAASAGGRGSGKFVATARGTMFHRPDCTVVRGRDDVRTVSAETSGLAPCGICDPLGTAESTAERASAPHA